MGRACCAAPFNGNVLVNLAAHHPALAFAPELLLRAQGIRVAFFDVDGVLTDGGLYISAEGGTEFTIAMAVSVLTMLIPLVLYIIFQRYIINTFAASGLKG